MQMPIQTLVPASSGVMRLALLLLLQGLVPTKGQGSKCPAWPLVGAHIRPCLLRTSVGHFLEIC